MQELNNDKMAFNFRTPQDMLPSEQQTVYVRFKLLKKEYTQVKRISSQSGVKIERLLGNIVQDYLQYLESLKNNA
jgi:hypothetical protein